MTDTSPDPAPFWPVLSAMEARVLGVLLEKELTTPDLYPLTLSSLQAACNQKSNRNPVMQADETAVLAALDTLREKKAAWQLFLAGNRVPKFRHALLDIYHVAEAAVPLLCELMLRGPQTAAELRARSARMRPFADSAAVEAALQALIEHEEGPFVVLLPREPGRRESRYAHLLCGPVATAEPIAAAEPAVGPLRVSLSTERERLAHLENEVVALRADLAALTAQLAGLLGP